MAKPTKHQRNGGQDTSPPEPLAPGTAVAIFPTTSAPQATVTVSLNQDHLIAIVISEAETRLGARLESAEPRRDWREAMAWRWWLRHRRSSSSDRRMRAVQSIGRDSPLTEEEQASYGRVESVLKDTFRASSAVECMNSVLRMQQSRHKTMSQPMLNLKRLYWNCHRFDSGPRKDVSPYQKLGLGLSTLDFWSLLQTDPKDLMQKLSTSRNTE